MFPTNFAVDNPLVAVDNPLVAVDNPLVAVDNRLVAVDNPLVAVDNPLVAVDNPLVAVDNPLVAVCSFYRLDQIYVARRRYGHVTAGPFDTTLLSFLGYLSPPLRHVAGLGDCPFRLPFDDAVFLP
ncbi:hypothetical protein ACOMHN_000283 [Nucella lapillus]